MRATFFTILLLFLISCTSPGKAPNGDSGGAMRAPASPTVSFAGYPDFKWCVATAAHQVEGYNINNDLYQWETTAANRVITREVIDNPAADLAIRNADGPFTAEQLPCPKYDPAKDKDPHRLNSVLFPANDGKGQVVCEFSGRAVGTWDRMIDPRARAQEIALLNRLGVTEYRFSIEWSRLEPQAGIYDENAVKVYADFIRALKDNGIDAQITLFHFAMPQWLRAIGGWENPTAISHFARFTDFVYENMPRDSAGHSVVKTWYTFNEPMVHVTTGYISGVLPPGKKSFAKVGLVIENILRAHAASYHKLHDLADADGSWIQVGVAHHLRVIDPASLESDQPTYFGVHAVRAIEQMLARIGDYEWNWMFFDAIEKGWVGINVTWAEPMLKKLKIKLPDFFSSFGTEEIPGLKGSQDFFGVNYYTRDMIKFKLKNLIKSGHVDFMDTFAPTVNTDAIRQGRVNDMHWEIYPEGLYRILKAVHQHGLQYAKGRPSRNILISETGIPDAQDSKRQKFLEDHLTAMKRAMDEGIPVKGLCYWSLLDNFEWNSGYYPKFGLYSVNFTSPGQERTLRPSGEWFAEMIRQKGFTPEH